MNDITMPRNTFFLGYILHREVDLVADVILFGPYLAQGDILYRDVLDIFPA